MCNTRLKSEIEAKFHTFWLPVKFMGGMGKMSELFLPVQPGPNCDVLLAGRRKAVW